jgi:hypothetical protein
VPPSDPLLRNLLFETHPLVVHAHGAMERKPAWPGIKTALFASPADPVGPVDGLTLLTCNNGHDAMGLFERSAGRLAIPCMVRGQGIDPWVNSRDKPRVIRDALHEITTEYVLYADSRDAVLLRDPREAIARLDASGCDLLWGGDRINWPAIVEFREFEGSLPGAKDTEFRYLNGGAWIGRTAFCRAFFDEAIETPPVPEAPDSEQGILKALFKRHYPRTRIDYRCEVFQNIGFVFADIFAVNGQ